MTPVITRYFLFLCFFLRFFPFRIILLFDFRFPSGKSLYIKIYLNEIWREKNAVFFFLGFRKCHTSSDSNDVGFQLSQNRLVQIFNGQPRRIARCRFGCHIGRVERFGNSMRSGEKRKREEKRESTVSGPLFFRLFSSSSPSFCKV